MLKLRSHWIVRSRPFAESIPISCMSRGPNILFIIADDHQSAAMGAYGDRIVRTPALDALAAGGTLFERCYIAGGFHPAVCVPTRAALLTACSPHRVLRVPRDLGTETDFCIEKSRTLLPERFRQAGWRTFGTGKWHNDHAAFQRSFDDGAAIFFGGMSSHREVPVHDFDPTGAYPQSAARVSDTFSTELFCNSAIAFLEGRQRARSQAPFFLYLALTSPHDPRTPPEEMEGIYPPEEMPLPSNYRPRHPFDNGGLDIRDERLAPLPRTKPAMQRELANYYGMISHQDRQLARVFGALDRMGERENTLVVYTSDHGLAMGQHGLLGKQNMYEHSVRTPLIMQGPGVPAGGRNSALVYAYDLFPTLCEMTGVRPLAGSDGRSFASVAQGEKTHRDCIFAFYKNEQRMVVEARWKRIDYEFNGTRRSQLFDLAEDPAETRDRSGDPACTAVRIRLGRQLDDWWQNLLVEAGRGEISAAADRG